MLLSSREHIGVLCVCLRGKSTIRERGIEMELKEETSI